MKYFYVLIFLIMAAAYDLKDRTVPVWIIALGFLGAFLFKPAVSEILTAFTAFFILKTIQFVFEKIRTEESLGEGDIYLFSFAGLMLNESIFLNAVFICLLSAGITAIKIKRLPLIPFLLLGVILSLAADIFVSKQLIL